jgi:hypothetical protein
VRRDPYFDGDYFRTLSDEECAEHFDPSRDAPGAQSDSSGASRRARLDGLERPGAQIPMPPPARAAEWDGHGAVPFEGTSFDIRPAPPLTVRERLQGKEPK